MGLSLANVMVLLWPIDIHYNSNKYFCNLDPLLLFHIPPSAFNTEGNILNCCLLLSSKLELLLKNKN